MKCPETIAFSFTVLFLKSFRVTSIQHSIIFHNIYQLVIKRPPRACTRHHELYYVIAVSCRLAANGKIELVSICLRNGLLRCVALRNFFVRACVALCCVAVRFVTMCCVAEFLRKSLCCVTLRCVTYYWKSGLTDNEIIQTRGC